MSTWTEVVTYIKTQLKPGVLGNTNVQKILNSVLAVIQQINAGDFTPSSDFVWNPEVSYSATIQPVLWQDQWLVSNIGANLGNVPISTSGVLHPSWRMIGSSAGSGIRVWQAIVYPNSLEVVYQSGQLYYLNRGEVGVDPFVSVDFDVELSEGKWVAFLEIRDHNQLEGIQGGIAGQRYHLTQEELLKLQRVTANTSANAVITYGTVVFTSPISATLELWEWLINGVEFADPSEILATIGIPVSYPRPDLFVGLEDGTIVYRPSVTDAFGNPVYPIISSNEVVLAVVIRDPDGNNIVLNPNEFFESAFPEQLFQTAVQADTTGLYAKVWEATILPDNTYHIQLSYGAPSSEINWAVDSPGKSGLLTLTFYSYNAIPISGIHFETVDGNSEPGDWALVRNGAQVALYHKSSNYWQRVYYRVILVAGAANKFQIFNRQVYAALPSGDQSFDSTTFAASGDDGREVELRKSATHIQWRYVGELTWIDLVPLIDLKGIDGDDGTEIELQVNGSNMLQWRYIGAGAWTDLFDLTTLAGSLPPGGTTSQVLTKLSATDGDADWETVKPPLHIIYANEAAMLAGQANQVEGYAYFDGTKEWRKLATSAGVIADYREIGGASGSGADTNAVHYNAADGKNAIEKQQARDNIGSTSATPQLILTAGAINDLVVTSNHLVFTGADVVLSGIVAGLNGEEITILNVSGTNLTLLLQSGLSAVSNRFNASVVIPNLSVLRIKYRTTTNRWFFENVGVNDGRYIRKDVADTKNGSLTFDYNEELGADYPIQVNNNSTSGNNGFLRANDLLGVILQINGTLTQFFRAVSFNGAIGNGDRRVVINSTNFSVGGSFAEFRNNGSPRIRFDTTGQILHARSTSADFSLNRSEQRVFYLSTITTAGSINNQALTAGIFNYRFTAATSITGFANGEIGRRITIQNDNTVDLVIQHQDVLSIAANRLNLIGAVALTIPTKGKADFEYCTGSRWELISKNF